MSVQILHLSVGLSTPMATESAPESIGIRIRQIREAHRLTQEALAAELDCSVQQVRNWENARSFPSLEAVFRLSRARNVSLEWLISGDGPVGRTETGSSAVEDLPQEDRLAAARSLPITILLGVIVEAMQLWLASEMARVRRTREGEVTLGTEALRRLRRQAEVFERWILATTELMDDIRSADGAEAEPGRLIKTVGEESSKGAHRERTDRIYEVREGSAASEKTSRGKKQKGG